MIVLDTHAWAWWVAGDRNLSAVARRRIDKAPAIAVSAISCWEVAMLVTRGRLRLDRDVFEWLEQALALPRVELVGITPEIAVGSTRLGAHFHHDPADQLIVATAISLRAPLVTRDERIRDYREVQTIW